MNGVAQPGERVEVPVRRLAESFRKLWKSRKLYLQENDILRRLEVDVRDVWGQRLRAGDVIFEVADGKMQHGDEVLLPDDAEFGELAAFLHRAGLRKLIFHPGAENGDVSRLARLFDQAEREAGADDPLNLLWEAGLRHVEYKAAETRLVEGSKLGHLVQSAENTGVPARPEVTAAAHNTIALDTDTLQSAAARFGNPGLMASSVGLTDAELDQIFAEAEADTDELLLTRGLEMVVDTLAGDEYLGDKIQLRGSIERMISGLVAAGRFRLAALAVRYAGQLAAGEYSDSDEIHQLYNRALDLLASDTCLQQAVTVLNREAVIDPAEVTEFFRWVARRGIEPMLQAATALRNPAYRREIYKVATESGGDIVRAVGDAYRRARPQNRTELLRLLPENSPPALQLLRRIAGTESDGPSRLTAVEIMVRMAPRDAAVVQSLLERLADEAPPVRAAAVRWLEQLAPAALAEWLLKSMDAEAFAQREYTERLTLVQAYGRVAPDAALKRFDAVLGRWSFFGRDDLREAQMLALSGLQAIENDAARKRAEAALKHRDKAVRERAKEILDRWGTRPGARAPGN